MARRASQLGLISDGSPWYQAFGFSHPSQRLCLHIICIHLHVVSAGPSITWEKHIFLARVLAAWIRAQVCRNQPYQILPFFGPLGQSFPHPSRHRGAWTPSQQVAMVSQSGSLDSPGPGSAVYLLCDLTSHVSSQCLHLLLWKSRVCRRSGSGA